VTPAKRAAGAVVVRPADDGWRYLVLRCYRNWDFPKGVIEPGEEPLATARREVQEETSLDGLELRWGEEFRETPPYGAGKIARFYVAVSPAGDVSLPVSEALGRPEHHEFRWVSYDDARRLLPPRLQPILDWAHALIEGDRAARNA
jgi:bis(5'-nucleosidyl)-tetraphosphatase